MNEYKYVDLPDGTNCIELTTGPYKGVIYNYGVVKFEENEEKDLAEMKFDYTIYENPNDIEGDKKDLIDVMGDVLVEILAKELKEPEKEVLDGIT
jgi:hypothetical protein